MTHQPVPGASPTNSPDPRESLPMLRRELGTGAEGLPDREAARRLTVHGANEVRAKEQTSIGRKSSVSAHPSSPSPRSSPSCGASAAARRARWSGQHVARRPREDHDRRFRRDHDVSERNRLRRLNRPRVPV